MPYIANKKIRQNIDHHLAFVDEMMYSAGHLNYAMTRLAVNYVKRHKRGYFVFLIVMGTFFCAALEFYRRWVAPYEDEKIKENGDVW